MIGPIIRAIATVSVIALATPASAQNWDGNHQVRFGAFIMGAGIDADLNATPAGGPTSSESASVGLYGVGVTAGIEWVRRQWAMGIEFDLAATAGNNTSASAETSIDYLSSLRGRIGVYAQPDLLLYATGGVAFLGAEVKIGSAKQSFTKTGLAVGLGAEWDRGPWLLSAEYLYMGFEAESGTIGTTDYRYDPDAHVFRLALKFKVGLDHYYDDVRARRYDPLK